ncbi:hypothetical protein CK203_021684 [Vitis vinifera]|uniref:Uncharacterized protein n=1 Tax=Vitis vinifera TaxID=29760 RepID=A0A438J4V5_VITVI|nr:hypothetical protein CK203_021684 [Vitis vinifera]
MDSDEQRLRDEVIYLHSLWHQGPPRKTNTNPNPRPISKSSRTLHQTSISKTFKNTTTKKHKTKPKKLEKAKKQPESDPQPPASGAEWPVQPISDQLSGWSKSPSLPTARPATAEEEAKLIALQIQEKGLAACREFFSRNESDDDDDDVDDDDLEEDGCEEFEFFVGLFSKDVELRSYYEKNNEGGIFCCLVCGGMGKKVGKRYKDCVGLVQHSSAISKTNKKRAHRSYGHGNSNGNTNNLDSTDDNLKSVIKDQNVDMDEVKGDSSDNADNLNVVVEDSNANGVELKDSLEEGKDTKLGDLDKGVLDATDVNTGELDCTKQRFLPNRPFEKEKWKHNETNNLSSPKLAEWDAHLSYKCFSLYMYKNADNLNVVVEDSNANGVELKEGNDSKLGDLDKGVLDAMDVHTGELDCMCTQKLDDKPQGRWQEGAYQNIECLDKKAVEVLSVNSWKPGNNTLYHWNIECPEMVPVKEDGIEPESKDSQEVIIVFGGANGGSSGVDLQQ